MPLDPPNVSAAPAGPGPNAPATAPPWRRPLTFGFALVAALILALMIVIYKPLVRPLLWAAALATLVYPAHRRLLDVVGGRATLAAAISTGAWIAVVLVPAAAAVNQLIQESRNLWPLLTSQFGTDIFARAADWAEASPLRRVLHLAMEIPADAGAAGIEARLRIGVETVGATILQFVRDLTLGAPSALLRLGITIVIFFFFLRQGPLWSQRLREALPLEPAHADALFQTAARTVGAVFRGVLLTAVSQALLATLGYMVAGAPAPVLLGFLTLITALLPFVGAAAVWLPTAAGLFVAGRMGAAVGLAAWGLLVVSLVDNFLRPALIGRGTHLPMLWLFLAILGGLQTFGFLGLLLGPAALAMFMACWRIYAQTRVLPPAADDRPAAG